MQPPELISACGAKTVSGPCPATPEPGKRRCRLHGGAKGSGAPKGNQNAYKHGMTTKEELAWFRAKNKFVRQNCRNAGKSADASRVQG